VDRFRVTRRFEFDSAHRLCGYDGPCGRIHGHRYVLEVTLEGQGLDEMDMLVDFAQIKSLVQPLIDGWDHNSLLWHADPLCEKVNAVVPLSSQPTAETIARLVWWFVVETMEWAEIKGVRLVNVRLYETPDCWVDYSDV